MNDHYYDEYDDYDERDRKWGSWSLFALLFTVCLFIVTAPVIFDAPSYECRVSHVVVEEGDTLDGIAREYCEGDVDDVVHLLAKMYGVIIHVGSLIHLPIPQG